MSNISSCPRCGERISLPAGAEPSRRMKCPLCDAIFFVRETSIPLQPAPPEAVPVSRGETRPSQSSLPAEPVAVEPDAPRETIHVEYLSDVAEEGSVSTSLTAHARTRGSGVFGQMVGTVFGGAIGLLIGYCVLVRIGGAGADFLHVAHLFPIWLVGELDVEDVDQPPARRPTEEPPQPTLSQEPPPVELFPPPDTSGLGGVDSSSDRHDSADPVESQLGNPQEATLPLPADYVGPRNIRALYTSDDLGQALAAAHAALGCPHCSSSGRKKQVTTEVEEIDGRQIERKVERLIECPVCDGKPITKITPDIYRQLSELAEVITFIDIVADDSSIWTRKEATIRILQEAGADRDRTKAIGRLAGLWLRNADRQVEGVLIAGTVQDAVRQGRLFQTRIVLFGNPSVVHVMSNKRAPFRPRDRVLVLGSIIDNPREQLVGYEGNQSQVVWGGLPVKLASKAK